MKYLSISLLLIFNLCSMCYGQRNGFKPPKMDTANNPMTSYYGATCIRPQDNKMYFSNGIKWICIDSAYKNGSEPLYPKLQIGIKGGNITSTGTIELDTAALKDGLKNGYYVDYDTLKHTYYIKGLIKTKKLNVLFNILLFRYDYRRFNNLFYF